MKSKWTYVAAAAALTAALVGCGKSDSLKAQEAATQTTPSTTAAASNGTPTTTAAASGPITLAINSPAPNTSVIGNVVTLALSVSGITIVKANGDTSGTTGHFHVFIDKDPVAPGGIVPKEKGIIHTAENPILLTGLTIGQHRIVVVVGDGSHRRIGDAQAETTVTVTGPSVTADAPAEVTAGQPAVITIAVDGVTLVKPDGDVSGKTGHLHLFVDRVPTPPGQPIPKEPGIIHTPETTVSIPDLAPGTHNVWVVLGNGSHIPFEHPVETVVTFVVK